MLEINPRKERDMWLFSSVTTDTSEGMLLVVLILCLASVGGYWGMFLVCEAVQFLRGKIARKPKKLCA